MMCQMIVAECKEGNQTVLSDVRRIVGITDSNEYIPTDPKELCNRIFYTCYMGTKNSSDETKNRYRYFGNSNSWKYFLFRAKVLASEVGSYHLSLTIDEIVDSFLHVFKQVQSYFWAEYWLFKNNRSATKNPNSKFMEEPTQKIWHCKIFRLDPEWSCLISWVNYYCSQGESLELCWFLDLQMLMKL